MKTILGAVAAAAVLFMAGCGGGASVSQQLEAEFSSDTRCFKTGFEEVAGEREAVYTCSGHLFPDAATWSKRMQFTSCAAMVEGEAYLVRAEKC